MAADAGAVQPGVRRRPARGASLPVGAKAWLRRFAGVVRCRLGMAGVVAVAVAAVRPWLEVPLQSPRTAASVRLFVAGLPTAPWATYGHALLALAGVAAVATGWRRGRATAVLGAAGLGVLVLCGLLLAQLILWDAGWRHLLVGQTLQKSVAVRQFGYPVRATMPSAIFLVPLSGAGRVIAGSLDHGFYLCLVGGALMAADGWAALRSSLRRRPRLGGALLIGGVLAVLGAAGPGVAAWWIENGAIAAAQRGDARAALDGLDVAARLVPDLVHDPDAELARGTALLQAGDRHSAPALFVLSRLAAAAGDRPRELALLAEAHRRAPADTVVVEEERARAIEAATRAKDPSPLLALGPEIGDTALVQYVTGRLFYDVGSYAAAVEHLRRVLQLTPDVDVLSSTHTYIGLADLALGLPDEAKHQLILAIELDKTASNGLARSTATGLYRGVLP